MSQQTTGDSIDSASYKRVKDMTPEERLRSLQEWAEDQKYVYPGEAGTLPFGGDRSMRALVYGGPLRVVEPQYTAPIAPPSYETATAVQPEKKAGALKRWLDKRKTKKNGEGKILH